MSHFRNPTRAYAGALALLVGLGLACSVSLAQELPNGPFANEQAYQQARQSVTKVMKFGDLIGLVRSVELSVSDQVDGKCWTEASAAQARLRAELERSGVAVFEEPLAFKNAFAPGLKLSALGYRIGENGPCTAFIELEVYYYSSDELGGLTYVGQVFSFSQVVVAWSNSRIITNGRNLDDQIMSFVQESADSLTADILSARRTEDVSKILSAWRDDPPMTQAAFDEHMKNSLPN